MKPNFDVKATTSTFDALQTNANAAMGYNPHAAFNATEATNLRNIEETNFEEKTVDIDGARLVFANFSR